MVFRSGNVALAGRPNAGKSTFLNYILGEKISIVSDKPQTTRNRILGVYHGENIQIGFIDLPGIHKPEHRMNRLMMRAVNQGLEDADVVLHFIDGTQSIGPGDRFVHSYLAEKNIPVIVVVNKIDIINKAKLIPLLQDIQTAFEPKNLVPLSAKVGDNTPRLLELLATFFSEESETPAFDEDMVTDQTLRFMAQELIREKILHYTDQEIPYATAVTINAFEEEADSVRINATIWAERANQRKILLGKEGSMISKIRQGARRTLKQRLEKPVELELLVKVKENWRNQDSILKNLELGN